MTMTIDEAPVAGWYPDPLDDNSWRWWDGQVWSQQVRPRTATAPVARRPVVQPAPPGVQHVESAAPAPQYAPPVVPAAAQPAAAPQPAPVAQPIPAAQPAAAIAEPVVMPEPASVPVLAPQVVITSPSAAPPATVRVAAAPVTAAPVAAAPSAPAPAVAAPSAPIAAAPAAPIAPSNELVRFDAAPIEYRYPWEAAIVALEAELAPRSHSVRPVSTPSPQNGGTRRPFWRGRRGR